MWPNRQFPVNLVTLTEEILNWRLYFLYSVNRHQEIFLLYISFFVFIHYFYLFVHFNILNYGYPQKIIIAKFLRFGHPWRSMTLEFFLSLLILLFLPNDQKKMKLLQFFKNYINMIPMIQSMRSDSILYYLS